jgi:hypothetical protein
MYLNCLFLIALKLHESNNSISNNTIRPNKSISANWLGEGGGGGAGEIFCV